MNTRELDKCGETPTLSVNPCSIRRQRLCSWPIGILLKMMSGHNQGFCPRIVIISDMLVEKEVVVSDKSLFLSRRVILIFSSRIQWFHGCIDGLVQDCSISIANALEVLQSCTKLSTCPRLPGHCLHIFRISVILSIVVLAHGTV